MPLGSPAGMSAGKMFQEVTANLSLTADTSGDVTAAAVLELEMGKIPSHKGEIVPWKYFMKTLSHST